MNRLEKVTQIVNRPDFDILIQDCIKIYNMAKYLKMLNLSVRDFANEVRISIFTRKLPKVEIKDTTFIYRKAWYLLQELLCASKKQIEQDKKKETSQIDKGRTQYNRPHEETVDITDSYLNMLELAKRTLSANQLYSLIGRTNGKTLGEIAKELGKSNERVRQYEEVAVCKIRRNL
jgi:hypothetical protein